MKSPYLNDHRLTDVLAAIQVMGSHFWDSRPIDDWKTILGPAPQSAQNWEAVFAQHPEFFGTNEWAGRQLHFLRLRRAYERNVDPDTLEEISKESMIDLKRTGKYHEVKLSRKALTPQQVEALMKTAIELQVRAAALADRARWWIPLAAAALGFVGAVAGSLLRGGT